MKTIMHYNIGKRKIKNENYHYELERFVAGKGLGYITDIKKNETFAFIRMCKTTVS